MTAFDFAAAQPVLALASLAILGLSSVGTSYVVFYHLVVLFQGWPPRPPTSPESLLVCPHADNLTGACLKACRSTSECDDLIARPKQHPSSGVPPEGAR